MKTGLSATAARCLPLAVLGGAALVAWLRLGLPGRLSPLLTIAILVGGAGMWREAIREVATFHLGASVPIACAVVCELALGDVTSALITTAIFQGGAVLETWAVARAFAGLSRPLERVPTEVRIAAPAGVPLMSLDSVQVGDVAIVLGGASFPVDGTVVGGCSLVDESVLTGRRAPVEKGPGACVLAGTLNQSSALEVRVDRVGRHTALRRIVDTLQQGCVARAPTEELADRMTSMLGWCGLTAAVAVFVATGNPRAAVAALVVATSGIAAGTRVALLTAVGQAVTRGAIVKDSVSLEALWQCDTAVLTSSAALILDEPVVHAVYPAAGVSVHQVLTTAATAERRSDHPIGRAIVRSAAAKRLAIREPDRYCHVPGAGIRASCEGEEILVGTSALVTEGRLPHFGGADAPSSTVFVMHAGRYLGAIALASQPRPDAKVAIAGLKSLAIRTHFLTADSRVSSEPLARQLMVDEFETELGPMQRLRRVQELAAKRRVLMVGDAREDGPALEAAMVGVTVGSAVAGLDQSADVMFLGNELEPLVDLIRLARRTRRVMLENTAGMLLLCITGVALAAGGALTPVLAALVRGGATIAFLLNASRLAPARS